MERRARSACKKLAKQIMFVTVCCHAVGNNSVFVLTDWFWNWGKLTRKLNGLSRIANRRKYTKLLGTYSACSNCPAMFVMMLFPMFQLWTALHEFKISLKNPWGLSNGSSIFCLHGIYMHLSSDQSLMQALDLLTTQYDNGVYVVANTSQSLHQMPRCADSSQLMCITFWPLSSLPYFTCLGEA